MRRSYSTMQRVRGVLGLVGFAMMLTVGGSSHSSAHPLLWRWMGASLLIVLLLTYAIDSWSARGSVRGATIKEEHVS